MQVAVGSYLVTGSNDFMNGARVGVGCPSKHEEGGFDRCLARRLRTLLMPTHGPNFPLESLTGLSGLRHWSALSASKLKVSRTLHLNGIPIRAGLFFIGFIDRVFGASQTLSALD